jgi:hypothetical protein
MNLDGLSPEGDLPPNHPLVLEALKGIISGPISELRTKVDNLITNPATSLGKGFIDYNAILPNPNVNRNFDYSANIANNLLNEIATVQYIGNQPNLIPFNNQVTPVVNAAISPTPAKESDPNQMELPLFKQADIGDIHNKLFDLERKLDIIIKHVKNIKN